MSVKISSRQNSRRKPLVDNAQSEVLFKLGLEAFWTTPLDPASMLDINTWNLENQPPVVPKYLPHAFLQRLWLLNPEARSTYCQPSPDSQANTQREDMVNGFGEESQCAANPLDLVTAVFMSANTFLQQDITVRMVQCQFAVPLVLPSVIPDQQSSFLLWPLRGVVSQWRSHSLSGVLEGDLASTKMPMMSFVKLGHCGVSKSWVLSRVLSGPKSLSQSFLHRGMDGGKLHRRLSNGLVELAWYLPTGDPDTDIFPVPVAISNLRGDAAAHEKCLSLLCRASSAVVVFCGNLREKEKRLLASWKGTASKIILIDLSDPGEEENENRVVGFLEQKLGDELGLPEGSVLSGGAVSEELLADRLLETLNDLLPGKLKHVTLEEAAGIAAELGLNVDEGAVCNKARATVEEVLKGLEEGSAQFREVQLPLQGQAWSTLSEMEKEASKQKKGEVNIEQQNEARNILLKLSSYRMTPAMKVFTDALFTTDKIERTYFLRWMKLSLRAKQMRELHSLQGSIKNQQELLVQGSQEVETELTNENVIETENAVNRTIVGDDADDDSFCTASTEEENKSVEDMLAEKPLSMDHTEENELDTEHDVNVHVAGDSHINYDLESSCSEDLTENQKLETQACHIAQSEEVKLNSVLPDAGEVALNNSFEESTDENMESEVEPVHQPSDDESFVTASTEEENNSVEDMLEENPLSMDHSEESDPQLPAQQTKPELGTANDVNVHVAGDSPIKHDLESSCSEDLIENQKLETEAGHIAQSEEDKLNSVALNNSLEQSTDENMESEEEPALGPSDDDSFCTASTEEENISVEDMLEEKPLSMDHTEESEPQLLDQQTKPELDTEYDVNVHVAGDSPIKHDLESSCAERLIQEMLGRLLRETEIQKLETQAGHIVQSEEVKLNSVLSDAGEVALINLLEDSTDENMESEEEPAHRPSDDSFCTASTEEENNSVEDMLEEKPLSIDHTEESEPQVPEQQTELDMDNEVKVHVAGDSPLKHDLESNCSEDLTEIQKLGHIAQCEEVQLSTVLPDAGEVAPNHSIEESNNENMESEEELVKKYSEMQDGEQNLSPQTPENADLVLRPTTADQNELEPTIEQQIYLTPDENRTMGPESTEIQDSFEDQEIIDQVNSADQQYHLESETMGEESEVPKIESQQTDSNPSVQNNLDLMDFSKKNNTDTVSLGFEPDPFSLSLEHFLREMGLIFELTHISPGNGSHNVLRLPSLAADLLLYGIPLELMDGDASNIPSSWLGCVLAEFKRRLPADGVRIRVLTNLGVYPARNGEVLSALFGANFPTRGKGFIKGIYMQPLCLPGELRRDMECDLLLMIDVEGLCSPESGREAATQVHDNEMATVATGLSDVLLHNLASNGAAKFESNLTVLINALLRTEVCGNTPVCKLLIQDEGLNSKLQALQLGRVAGILQAEPEKIEIKNNQKPISHIKSSIPCLIGPWQNISISQPVDKRYSEVVLQLKQSLFEAFGKCAAKSKATGLPEFMRRLCAIWEAVKAESFSIGLGNTEVAASFSMMCTELSQWEKLFLENMEIWFMGAQKRITSTKTEASETRVKGKLLSLLKDEVKEEVKAEVDKIRSKLEAYLIQNDQNKTYIETYHPNIMNNMNELQEQVTEEMIERLELAKDNHYLSTHLRTFEAFLEKEQELKLRMLVENSKLTTVLLEDMQLEEEFEPVWDNALSTFDLRPSQTSDINTRVIEILIDNLNSRGLQKHMIRLQKIIKKNTAGFEVHDEHFGYNTRMKYMFEDNNKKQRLAAHRVACTIIEEYNRFVAEKSNLLADFSDGYITELLENVEKTLRANPMEIRSAFEVDLKVYICGFARKDFQEIHDRYAKDRDLLAFIKRSKERRQGEFIYQFRKRDQCHRVAQAFTSMVFKPTALDYIYESLGRHIVEEMVSQENGQQYLSPLAFNCSLLEKLLDEDSFGSFLEYLLSYESFSLKKIQERVLHLSKSAIFDEWRRQRLGEIVGKMSAAVSQTSVGVSEKLSDTKLLLEMVCLNLEKERDVAVTRASLDGPLFSITVEWDYFVSCLLEALAEMRLALAHEFSQDTDIAELLQALPVQPQESLFNRVRGCEKQCPFCRAPCEVGGVVHDMHRAVLHRPKGMLSYTYHDSCSLSHTSCLSDTTKENLFLNKDTDGQSLAYRDYSSIYPDWSIHPVEPDTKTPIAYWRYVLMRFNERFAEEYEQQPAQLPDDWLHITREEALESLREASTLSSVGGYHNNYTL